MEYNEVLKFINPNNEEDVQSNKYVVTYIDNNGKKATRAIRMFVRYHSTIGYFVGKARANGYKLNPYMCENWINIRLAGASNTSSETVARRMRKRAADAVKMLEKSGLWTDIKKELETFLALDEETQMNSFVNKQSLFELRMSKEFPWFTRYSIFEALKRPKCWEYISFDRWRREEEEKAILRAIKEKGEYRNAWQEDYDRSVEVRLCEDGQMRAWFSKEFRGYGNGHYYLMFDEKHAIHLEDD